MPVHPPADVHTEPAHQFLVHVNENPAKGSRHQSPDRALARRTKTDERDTRPWMPTLSRIPERFDASHPLRRLLKPPRP
jgi:hypothetical protein